MEDLDKFPTINSLRPHSTFSIPADVTVVTIDHPLYPPAFLSLVRPPEVLMVRGDPNILLKGGLSAVGSRKLSLSTKLWIERHFPTFFSKLKIPLISGGAIGSDQCLHRAAILAGVPTICFLPSGIANPYPANLIPMLKHIIQGGGAVVSQFPAHALVRPGFFHVRNELIAALGDALFVVEARHRSGTMMTAKKALDLGREVAVLPHSPGADCNQGGLDLIRSGARMICDELDLLEFCLEVYKARG